MPSSAGRKLRRSRSGWESARQRRQFVELPYTVYVGDPMFVPPLRRDEYRRLAPKHNPLFEHASLQLWLAMDGDRPVCFARSDRAIFLRIRRTRSLLPRS